MAAIDEIPLADRKRFGTAFLFMQDQQDIDWKAAAAAYDPKVKPESFSTVTKRALKKGNTSVEGHTDADLARFAICFIFAVDNNKVDWKGAAAAYGSKVKPESFSTMTKRALKKVAFGPVREKGVSTAGKKKSSPTGDETAGDKAGTASIGDGDGDLAKSVVNKGRKRKGNTSTSTRGAKKIKTETESTDQNAADEDVGAGADDSVSQAENESIKHEADGYGSDPLLSEEAHMIGQQINGGM